MLAASLAHEGGWDEILLVGGPILLIVGLLAVVKRRVDAQMPEQTEMSDETEPTDQDRPDQDRPDQDRPDQDRPDQDRPDQD